MTVHPVLRLAGEAGYAAGRVTVVPGTVRLLGPADRIRRIDSLPTLPLEVSGADGPVEQSVATRTPTEPGVFIDDTDGGPGSIRNKAERRKVLRKVYGDSALERGGWEIGRASCRETV